MNESIKSKQFAGVKMDRTKSREYKVGKKKLSKKLKNIKMFEEFVFEEKEEKKKKKNFVVQTATGIIPTMEVTEKKK